jgi:hypothetical protein
VRGPLWSAASIAALPLAFAFPFCFLSDPKSIQGSDTRLHSKTRKAKGKAAMLAALQREKTP